VNARPTGIRLIVAYKLAKAVAQIAIAVFLWYGARHGLAASLAELAERLREHAVHSWSDVIGRAVARLARTPRSLWWGAVALGADAVVSAFEGWTLVRGYRWGPWLVVTATASLLPFEAYHFVRHPRVGRLVLLLINAAIVVYLSRRARQHAIAT